MLERKGKCNLDSGEFNWKDALIDAAIMSGLTFFTTMTVTSVLTNPIVGVLSAGISAASEFFLILAIKRGLKEE